MKILLVTHIEDFAKQTKGYLLKMIPNLYEDQIIAVGGDVDGGVGSDTQKISDAISKDDEQTLIICDLGSSVLSSIAATSLVKNESVVSSGSFVEGSFAAATLMAAGATFESVVKASQEIVSKK